VLRCVSLLAVLVAAAVSIAPAGAITGGQPDSVHTNVGLLLGENADGSLARLCSGTLVAPKVFLTAAHCLEGRTVFRVSFDAASVTTTWRGTGVAHATDDVGVVLLDEAPPVAAAALPAAGSLDKKELQRDGVVSVGYGYDSAAGTGGGVRRSVSSPVKGLKQAIVILSVDGGGPCMGDSGGPQLLGDTVISITLGGNESCTKKVEAYRLDTPSARSFLAPFVQ
jgi:hypothetical protein